MPPRILFTVILALTLAGCLPQTQPAAPTATPPISTRPLEPTSTPLPLPETPGAADSPTAAAPAITNLPEGSTARWAPVVSGLFHPVDIQNAGDERLFIIEQNGRIRTIQGGQLNPEAFLDIVSQVGSNGSEQGLLGLAFHPKFAENGYFFVNYTDKSGTTHIARFTASGGKADPASEKTILTVQQPFANHNGGGLAFGPDGYLYIALGDGGSGGDPYNNGQSLNTLLGKILRLDIDSDAPYAIPADNPFVGRTDALQEIWAYGLRNPWRISFDRLNGNFYIADVGQNQWEEINFVPAGEPGGINFGWNAFEGMNPYEGGQPINARMPVVDYSHTQGCSVSGGYVYRGENLPDWNGVYLYGDYCSGNIWGLIHFISTDGTEETFGATVLFDTEFTITTFGVDSAGEIYLADYSSGTIYRLEKAP